MVSLRFLARAWSAYQASFSRNPWRTQMLTTAAMFTTSDILTQHLVEKKGSGHDVRRTMRMCIMGLIIGPIQRTWFLTLERVIPPTSKVQIIKKLIVDQTVYGPFIIFFFYSLSGTLSGKKPHEVKLLLQEKYFKTMLTAFKVWPFVQAVNFSLVPLQHRANFVQVVSLCWNMYLSWMSNKPVVSKNIEYQSSDVKSNLLSDVTKKD